MATREQRRARVVPAIARLARSRDFRSSFAEGSSDPNRQTIIPALPDDTVGYVLDRVGEAGGAAILVLATDTDCTIAALQPASEARLAVAKEDDSLTVVHEHSHVEMLFDYLMQADGAVVIERVAAKLVTQSPLQPT